MCPSLVPGRGGGGGGGGGGVVVGGGAGNEATMCLSYAAAI